MGRDMGLTFVGRDRMRYGMELFYGMGCGTELFWWDEIWNGVFLMGWDVELTFEGWDQLFMGWDVPSRSQGQPKLLGSRQNDQSPT